MHLLSHISSYLFPISCLVCGQTWAYLCSSCNKKLQPHPEICPRCHRISKEGKTCLDCFADRYPLAWATIWFFYTETCKQLVWQMKYQRRYEIGSFFAKKLALQLFANQTIWAALSRDALITYVPMHWWKQHFLRWFNQAEHLAKELANELDLPIVSTTQKVRHTRSQTRFSKEQREANLQDLFTKKTNYTTQSKTYLLVDDITTTWTTLLEVAKQIQLLDRDAQIWWVVIARHGS